MLNLDEDQLDDERFRNNVGTIFKAFFKTELPAEDAQKTGLIFCYEKVIICTISLQYNQKTASFELYLYYIYYINIYILFLKLFRFRVPKSFYYTFSRLLFILSNVSILKQNPNLCVCFFII